MAEMRAELVGLLIEKHGERAKIKLDKDKSKGEKIPKYLEAWCPINAKVGDVVGVEYQEMNKRKMQMILYGFPVLSVIAGAVFGNSIAVFFDIDKTMPVMLGVVIWLLVSVNYARIFKRDAVREGVQPVVIEIEAPDPIVFDDTEDEKSDKELEDSLYENAHDEGQYILDENGKPKETYEVTAINNPWIRKGELVKVGAGDMNFRYIVTSITHNAINRQMNIDFELADESKL